MGESFILKGNICYSIDKDQLASYEDQYVICENGISRGIFREIPKKYEHFPVKDCQERLIIPGFTDLHIHAPQYGNRGIGMDLELLEWLEQFTFPEEGKYADLSYATKVYQHFVKELTRGETTRACIFATIHVPATRILMELLEQSGMITYVGKVHMDRNGPEYLLEKDIESVIEETSRWIVSSTEKYKRTNPILTPRFIPSCSDELMKRIKGLQEKFQLPLQSHLSENPGEIAWVKELCPWADFYGDAYDRYGLFGSDGKTIMAHCVYSDEREQERMKKNGVFIAHCPESNINLASGIAPVKKYLRDGQKVGIGSDVAGGTVTSMFMAMRYAIQASKMYWRYVNKEEKPLSVEEVFYMATKGGGAFFGNAGSLEEGYEFDTLVIDDNSWNVSGRTGIKDRIEQLIYLGDSKCIVEKYIAGRKVF